MKILTATAMFAALLLSGCFEGANQGCTSNCFSLNGIENDSPAQVDAKIKKMCESMGRKGAPEVKERTKSVVAGYCAE